MRNIITLSIGLVLAIMAAGCGSSTVACQGSLAGVDICAEVDGECGSPNKIVDACSTTNVLGTCEGASGNNTGTVFIYSTNGTTAADAQVVCTAMSGTWKAK